MVWPVLVGGGLMAADFIFNKGKGTKHAAEQLGDMTGFGSDPKRLERDAASKYAEMAQQYEGMSSPSVRGLAGKLATDRHGAVGYRSMADPYARYQADQGSLAGQQQALGQMQQWAAGGMTDADRGMAQIAERDNARYEQAQRLAVLQQMSARGMSNSGTALAGQLAAQQGGANRLADSQAQMMGNIQDRSLAAGSQAGQIAYGMGSQINQANQFRLSGQDDRERFRVKGIADWHSKNTDRRVDYQKRLGDARQSRFNNEIGVKDRIAGVYGTQAGYLRDQAQDVRDRRKDTVKGIGKVIEYGVKASKGGA